MKTNTNYLTRFRDYIILEITNVEKIQMKMNTKYLNSNPLPWRN